MMQELVNQGVQALLLRLPRVDLDEAFALVGLAKSALTAELLLNDANPRQAHEQG